MFGASCRVFTGANAFYKIPLFFGCRRLRNVVFYWRHILRNTVFYARRRKCFAAAGACFLPFKKKFEKMPKKN